MTIRPPNRAVAAIAAAALLVATHARSTHGALIDGSLDRDIDGAANAIDVDARGNSDTFSFGPVTEPVALGGDTTQFFTFRERGNAFARAKGEVYHSFSQQDVYGAASLTEVTRIRNSSETAAAQAGFDALAAFNAAVGLAACELSVCDVDASGTNSASDSLGILAMAVGLPFTWDCPLAAGVGQRPYPRQ